MAAIITRSTQLAQPHGPVEIAPYWLGRSPVLLASGGAGFINAVNKKPPTIGSTARFRASAAGIGVTGTASSTTSSVLFDDFEFGGTTPITALAFSDELPSANRSFLGQDTEVILRVSSAGTGVEWILNSFSTNDRTTAVANSRATPGFFAAGTYGPSGKLRAYANTAVAEITPTGTYANATGVFSAIYTQGLNQLFDKRLALVALFRSELSQAELRTLSENPWQLFKPIQRRTFFLPASGGGGGVVSNASASLTGLGLSAATASASGAATALAVLASTSLTPATATASGGAAIPATASAVLSAVGIAAAQAQASGAAQSSAALHAVTIAPATASATGGAAIPATATASLAALSVSPASASASGGVAIPATASASLASLIAIPAQASASGAATAAGPMLGINLTPAQAQASAAAWAAAEIRAIGIAPANATARGPIEVPDETPMLSVADPAVYLSVADPAVYLSVADGASRQSNWSLT